MRGWGDLEEMKGSLPRQDRQSPKQTVTALGTANGRTTPAKADTGLSQEEWLLPSKNAPLFPPPPRMAGPSPGGGRQGHGTLCPASSRVTWAAGSGGGSWRCQHPLSRGAPAQAPTLPPSRAPTPRRGGCSVPGSRNLRGAGLGSRAPHYCFISRGSAKNNAGHETKGT